ncbi:SDR family NAD(P)-dependent oxidoreductase [Curvibacter sp. APW13]|uniref:SDR family NAD(P)-dependent oxidoreductase n=1 Tax=Curvibacter sp. APW13 TaxID=3077236 RepID=UPI0028DE548F|nr:SDR family NAD(P)-dependent oxidoreductase [Curvibacter sp. APW13]MDT8989331.1 SDR family NAD(P)-dependent oxidoreductase [Curvibacter sp. APW13]
MMVDSNPRERFVGKVVVVTGAAGQLGRAIALAFAAQGAQVVATDIHAQRLDEVAQDLQAVGSPFMCKTCDVSSSSDVKGLFDTVKEKFGTVHVLVNNAAIVPERPDDAARRSKHYGYLTTPQPRQSLQFTSNLTDEDWHRYWGVNVHGVFYCTREALRMMEPQGEGRIINVASTSGISALSAHSPHYSASKGAVIAFTKSVAAEVAGANIFVNAMAPGGIETQAFKDYLAAMTEEQRNRLWQIVPAGRLGALQEYTDTVLFLAGPHYLVGQVISPNGGMVI